MTERELVSIVEMLKEYQNILLGHDLEEFTDHNNLVSQVNQLQNQSSGSTFALSPSMADGNYYGYGNGICKRSSTHSCA